MEDLEDSITKFEEATAGVWDDEEEREFFIGLFGGSNDSLRATVLIRLSKCSDARKLTTLRGLFKTQLSAGNQALQQQLKALQEDMKSGMEDMKGGMEDMKGEVEVLKAREHNQSRVDGSKTKAEYAHHVKSSKLWVHVDFSELVGNDSRAWAEREVPEIRIRPLEKGTGNGKGRGCLVTSSRDPVQIAPFLDEDDQDNGPAHLGVYDSDETRYMQPWARNLFQAFANLSKITDKLPLKVYETYNFKVTDLDSPDYLGTLGFQPHHAADAALVLEVKVRTVSFSEREACKYSPKHEGELMERLRRVLRYRSKAFGILFNGNEILAVTATTCGENPSFQYSLLSIRDEQGPAQLLAFFRSAHQFAVDQYLSVPDEIVNGMEEEGTSLRLGSLLGRPGNGVDGCTVYSLLRIRDSDESPSDEYALKFAPLTNGGHLLRHSMATLRELWEPDGTYPNSLPSCKYGARVDDKWYAVTAPVGHRVTVRGDKLTLQDLKDVAHALSFIHWKGIIHRDIELRNLIVWENDDKKKHVCVIDFGTSCAWNGDAIPHQGATSVGSPDMLEALAEEGPDASYTPKPSDDLWCLLLSYLKQYGHACGVIPPNSFHSDEAGHWKQLRTFWNNVIQDKSIIGRPPAVTWLQDNKEEVDDLIRQPALSLDKRRALYEEFVNLVIFARGQ